jgi:hypothetical protein
MTFSVQSLLGSLNQSGFHKTSHFSVQVMGPNLSSNIERTIEMRGTNVDLPGRNLLTKENRPTGLGPFNKIAYGQTYPDITMQVLVSEDFRERQYFEHWQAKMVGTGAFEPTADPYQTGSSFNVGYFDNYAGTVLIKTYNSGKGVTSIHKLQQAYPIFIGTLPMSWDEDSLMKMTITFAYKYYRAEYYGSTQPGLGLGFSVNLGPNGISGGLRLPGVGSISASSGAGLTSVVAKVRSALPNVKVPGVNIAI